MPQITIEYCVVWNYLPKAAGLADSIREQHGVDPVLIKGRSGIFDVRLDGDLVFSKHELGRFPDSGEVEAELRARLGSG